MWKRRFLSGGTAKAPLPKGGWQRACEADWGIKIIGTYPSVTTLAGDASTLFDSVAVSPRAVPTNACFLVRDAAARSGCR